MEDNEAVRRCQQGDSAAFAVLVERHQSAVLVLCLRMTGNRADALDASQQALTKAYRHLGQYDPGLPFRPWLLRIAGNECIGLMRKRARAPLPLKQTALDLAAESDVQQDHAGLYADRESVRAAIQRLPEEYRRVVVRYYFEQLSYTEIAEREGIPVGTVGTHLHRAKQMLRRILSGEEGKADGTPQSGDASAISVW